ncbi:MAG: T9SS type A sorting domain-containing protein, partial [Salinivenus sp.]
MRTRCLLILSLLLGLSLALTVPAAGQEILVQNGTTVEVNNGGVWDLQGGTMDFGPAGATAALSEPSGGRVYNGLLTAVRALSNPTAADPAGLGIEITASNDLGDVTVTRGHAIQTASNGNESIERYYEISPSQNNSSLSAELRFSYNDAELNGRPESDLEFFKSTDGGSSWSEEGFDSRDATANTVTLSGIASLSRWTLGSEASPLPVELARFEAAKKQARGAGEEAIQLTWTTAAEQNNAGFEVQRRIVDARAPGARRGVEIGSWQQVGYRESTAAGGTTAEAQTYRFTDEALPYAADTLAYRLRQVDTDGSATLTDPVTVGRGGPDRLRLLGTAPNPARQRATVRYGVPGGLDDDVVLRLYDMLGRRVRTVTAGAEAGRHEQTLELGGLSPGVYVLRLRAGGATTTKKLT